ncbi:hypothetical protein BXZ70DRAFT_944181 [Cristinia sonorae]|uniref:Uncharacterized protein n=1 Tax=Cristinia sonorae TaxID=1940300 RepID=A0A8K0XNL8_9AGAR|nr:hypothetical protein BXZ70DRAFT_944181 [Cristinia sonorae]
MAMSSPLCFQPTTPTSHRFSGPSVQFFPLNSSPLASSPVSPKSSPLAAAQTRRHQYKQVASSPTLVRNRYPQRNVASSSRAAVPASDGMEIPRKAVLRERFKAKCVERAQKDRARRVSGKRGLSSDASSDGIDADMECGDDDDDEFLNDELFSRIMKTVNHKQKYQYKLSYQHDVGSSFDPELEDVDEWENELQAPPINTEPDDLNEEELAAYAEEYQMMQELQDIPLDDIFSLSDLEDVPEEEPFDWKGKGKDQDVEMD